MKRPNQQELNKINSVSTAILSAENCYVIDVIGADNLISRSQTKWDKDGLARLKNMAPGIPVLVDHEWEVGEIIGLCFDARLEIGGSPTLTDYGMKSFNDTILSNEGWIKLILSVALTCEDALKYYQTNKFRAVSLGGFNFEYYECGECGVDINSPKCPHMVPTGYNFLGDSYIPEAPYVIRRNPIDLAEVSFVAVPNLPNAQVLISTSVG